MAHSSSFPRSGSDHAAEDVHAAPPRRSAYRRWFAGLHPSLQLVLLQLWMPVFMAVMFVLCYVAAFQHTAPRDVPVGVVGEAAAVTEYQTTADEQMPGAWAFEPLADEDAGREAVRGGELAAAYDPEANALVVAAAHQAQTATLIPAYVGPLLNPQEPPERDDIAPLPIGDVGMTPMYLMLAWCISGYLAAMFIGLMGAPLRRLTRFAVIGGGSLLLSFITSFLVSPVLGAIEGHFWQLWGLGWAWAAAIGLAVNGLSYFCGRFIAAPAMTIFIFLSIPASGAAFPEWFMPEPFRWLNHVVVGSGITEMLKRLIYDVGPGYTRGWTMLLCYAAAGLVLTAIGKPFWEWRRVRRMLRGKTTMMQDAQRANGRQHEQDRDAILAGYGLAATPDGFIVHQRSTTHIDDAARAGGEAADGWGLGAPLESDLDGRPDDRPGRHR